MRRRPPRSTRPDTLFPYTTLFRSAGLTACLRVVARGLHQARLLTRTRTMGDDMAIMAKAIERSAGLKAGTRTILLYRCAASALAVGLLAVPSIGHAQSGLELSKQQAEDEIGRAHV